ncbi:MAG: hypothetical protein E7379_01070 [Clostridiales bacterium]|nr:hypothetical protein [Clostridiales bacterium]
MFSKKSKNTVFLLIVTFVLLFAFLLSGLHFTNTYALDANKKNACFWVEVSDRSDQSLTASETIDYSYNELRTAKAFVYNVENTYRFKLHFDFSQLSDEQIPSTDAEGYCTLKVTYEYLKGYSSAKFTDEHDNIISAVTTNTIGNTLTSIWDKETSFKDKTLTVDICPGSKVNWGIYRFKVMLGNNISLYSDFFILQPKMQVGKPTIGEPLNNKDSDKYVFNVDTTGEYRYVDENQIKWYVYGKTTNGENYSLLQSDLNIDKFEQLNCDKYLYKDTKRAGFEFSLLRAELPDGEWTVWCEYAPYGTTNTVVSNELHFGKLTNTLPIIWIIAGFVVLCIALTSLVVFVKIKKEKIY